MAASNTADRSRNPGTGGLLAPNAAWVALGFGLLTLAFLPLWIDPEAARRGIGCLLVGGLLLVGRPGQPPWPMLLPLGLGLMSWLWAPNSWEAGLRLTWWLAIAGAALWARGADPVAIARGCLPAGAVVSVWALAQQAGFHWPFDEGLDLQASSTLGNRNTAAQVIALTAIAGAFAAGHGGRAARVAAAVVGMLAAVALTLHPAGSRGGMLGLAVAMLWLLAVPERKTYMRGVLAVLVAGAGGYLAAPSPQPSTAPPPIAASATPDEARPSPPTPSTVDVRLGLWKAGLELWQEAPLFGQGLGQLRTEFPRVRDPHEHDLSSYNRSFRTEVGHAHNDVVEILVELGVAGLLAVLVALGWMVARARSRGWAACVPMVAGVTLCLTYSALLNAPVALALAAWVGATLGPSPATDRSRWRSWAPAAAVGGVLLFTGFALSSGHRSGEAFQAQARREANLPPTPLNDPALWLKGALGWMPWSDRLHAALARRRRGHDLGLRHAHRAHLLAPHHVEHMLLLGELAVQRGELKQAAEWVEKALRIDPQDHEAQAFAAGLAYRSGNADQAVAMLYTDPHPRLREEWPSLLEQFRDLARSEGEARAADALRFDAELAFVRTLDSLTHDDLEAREPAAWVATGLDRFSKFEAQTGTPRDLRPWILAAWLSHRLGDSETATLLGERARKNRAQLGTLVRPLVAPYLEDLAELEAWRGW